MSISHNHIEILLQNEAILLGMEWNFVLTWTKVMVSIFMLLKSFCIKFTILNMIHIDSLREKPPLFIINYALTYEGCALSYWNAMSKAILIYWKHEEQQAANVTQQAMVIRYYWYTRFKSHKTLRFYCTGLLFYSKSKMIHGNIICKYRYQIESTSENLDSSSQFEIHLLSWTITIMGIQLYFSS